MKNLIQKYLIREYRARITPAAVRRALVRKVPSQKAAERRYASRLRKLQRELNRTVREQIQPLFEPALRMDAVGDVDGVFGTLAAGIGGLLNRIRTIVTVGADGGFAANGRKYEAGIFAKLGFNAIPETATAELRNNWVDQNVELISKINADQLAALKGIFRNAAFTGVRASELREQISKQLNQSEKKINFLARDQIQKLGGQLDQHKQTSSGVEGYYWRTSRDERVRLEHAEREGEYFAWDKPPEGGHPGQDYGCRCDAEPAVDKFLLSGKELKESNERLQAQNERFRREAIAKSKAK